MAPQRGDRRHGHAQLLGRGRGRRGSLGAVAITVSLAGRERRDLVAQRDEVDPARLGVDEGGLWPARSSSAQAYPSSIGR